MGKRSYGGGSQYFGLALSFSVVMVVSVFIMFHVGSWIDSKLGTGQIFTLVFSLMGIFSAFRVLYSDIQSIERKINRREEEKDDGPWYAQ